MHFAAKNLLYTFHKSLDTQFVTVGMFKRYARSPENRTFRNYFRNVHPGDCFIPYLRKRSQNSLSRYITKHRRKKNPILTNFVNQTITSVMEKLQQLKTRLSSLRSHASSLIIQNKPILQTDQNGASRFSITDYRLLITDNRNKNKPISNLPRGRPPCEKKLVNPVNPVKIKPCS